MRGRPWLLALAASTALGANGDLELDELLGRMASTPGVVAEFREVKKLALLDAPLESTGTIYFVPPDRLARVTLAPAVTRLVIDGERFRFEDPTGASDVDLAASPVARQFAENLLVLWTGKRAALEKTYRLQFESTGARWSLALVPRAAPLDQFIARIELAGDGATMKSMLLVEKDGDSTATEFTKSDVAHRFTPEEERAIFARGPAK